MGSNPVEPTTHIMDNLEEHRCQCGRTVAYKRVRRDSHVTCSCGKRVIIGSYFVYTCPNCGNKSDGEYHPPCDWVIGRRGWRQLGVYDG